MKRNNTTNKIFIELPLELGCVTCTGIVGTCNCFGSICESRGLSNLTPARSRLFKLIGKNGVGGEVAAATKHIWWLTYANKSEKRSRGTDVN